MNTPTNIISNEELYYQMLLVLAENIGNKTIRKLLLRYETASNICNASAKELKKFSFLSEKQIKAIKSSEQLVKKAEEELEFIRKNKLNTYFITDEDYPQKLALCNDAPVLFFQKGDINLNKFKTVTIIGTRDNTLYGTQLTEELIEGIKHIKDISVISGLAYGIDIIAHKKALQCNIPTIGVLAHGLDRIYPAMHKNTAKEMINNGGLITEYFSGTKPDKQNFPMRNRIAAGLSDVTVVIETDIKGGSMITAKLATAYNREVAAFPGRVSDTKSSGCNYLIANNIAQLISSADDLLNMMNWAGDDAAKVNQAELFTNLSEDENKVVQLISGNDGIDIDTLLLRLQTDNSKLAGLLLNLELQGILQPLPGKRFRIK